MALARRSRRRTSPIIRYLALSTALTLSGCASPGPPRAPSLNLPQPVRDLTATRLGNTVELHFTAPSRSTDKLPLRGKTVTGELCRQLPHQPCIAVPSSKISIATANPNGTNDIITWTDTLPANLTESPAQLLAYRVEFFSPANRSAGPSAPAFTATGPAPAPVENLQTHGSRLGIILTWSPSSTTGDVVLQREDLTPAKPHQKNSLSTPNTSQPPFVWLQTHAAPAPQTNRTLDTTALPDTTYRYIAQRRLTVQLGHRSIELRSSLSAPISFTLLQIYPPPTPTGLTALGYTTPTPTGTPSAFAVDLIWQPVNETGLITPLAGYNLYREPLNTNSDPTTPRVQLNPTPIPTPSFHDTTASPTTPYRYTVTTIDIRGNESPAATAILQPSTAP